MKILVFESKGTLHVHTRCIHSLVGCWRYSPTSGWRKMWTSA